MPWCPDCRRVIINNSCGCADIRIRIAPRAASWKLPLTARCSYRGSSCRGTGRRQLDPYESDVNGRRICRYLCEPCVRDLANAI